MARIFAYLNMGLDFVIIEGNVLEHGLFLPIRILRESYPSQKTGYQDNTMIQLEEMSILIVDDIESMCKSIRGMLKVLQFGKKIRYAFNGLEAWKSLQEVPVDLLIVDWNMPVMNGLELLERVRESPQLRDIPVVMVTAAANSDIVAEAAESDIDAYILKPLTVKSLGDRIAAVIERANNPPPMFSHLKKARILKEAGKIDQAIEETKLAMQADRLSSKPLRELGLLCYEKEAFQEAEKWLLRAASMNKLDVFAFHHLGEICLKRNDIDNAARWFEKAMSVSPRHVSRGIYFGKVLIQKGMLERAEAVLDQAFELAGREERLLREDVINFSLKHRAYPYALKLLHQELKSAPDRVDILVRMGTVYEKMEEPLSAIKYLSRADEVGKNNIGLKLRIAENYMKIGQVLRADQLLRDVLVLEPGNDKALELRKKCV
jgi:CheY-like chemotaxis protein